MKNKILSLLILAIFAMSISSFAYSITGPITTGTDTHWSTTSGFVVDLTEDATYVYAKFSIKGPAFISGAYLGLTVDSSKVIPWDVTTGLAVAANGATAGTIINKNAWIPSNWAASGTYRATTAPYDYLAAFACPPTPVNKAIADGVTQELFTSVFKKQLGYSNIQSSGLAYFAGTLAARGTKVVYYTTAAKSIGNVETVASTTAYNAPLATYYSFNVPAAGFNVDYVENGGSAVTDLTAVTALPGTLPTPTKDGYTFDGWFYANDTLAKANDVIAANTTLTAKWTVVAITDIPLVSGDVVKETGKNGVSVKVRNGSAIVDGTVDNAVVVTIPGKVPATIDSQAAVEAHQFGIEFGGVKFPAGFNASTFANLTLNGGKYIIKLVDTSGKLTGKTFKAYNYFDTQKSTDFINITID